MRIGPIPLAIAVAVSILFGSNSVRAESPSIILLNIDKNEIDLVVVDNLNPNKDTKTVFKGKLKPGKESKPFKVMTKPGGTDFTWIATGRTEKAKRCGTVTDKNRGGRVDVLAGTTLDGKTPVGKAC